LVGVSRFILFRILLTLNVIHVVEVEGGRVSVHYSMNRSVNDTSLLLYSFTVVEL